MRSVYEAENSVEAHMVLNLLALEGIEGRVDGEYLQGGMGELQAIGLVQVMVEDDDYDRANKIVQDWDAKQPRKTLSKPPSKSHRSMVTFCFGTILGVSIMALVYNTPVTEDGIDYNGDGILDEVWTYANYRNRRMESDRNLDGEVDAIYRSNQKGIISSGELDNDFDGEFETELEFRNGNVSAEYRDTNQDGEFDLIYRFRFGELLQGSLIDPETRRVRKIQTFENGRLVSAQVDTDDDGVLDTEVAYDIFEEPIETSLIK